MSNLKGAANKWKDRWKSKIDIAKAGKKKGGGSIIGNIHGVARAYKDDDIDDETIQTLKETSRPENNALTVAMTPEIPEPEEQPIIPIPDESLEANEARRRRARRSRTGRQSTILTGLGG